MTFASVFLPLGGLTFAAVFLSSRAGVSGMLTWEWLYSSIFRGVFALPPGLVSPQIGKEEPS